MPNPEWNWISEIRDKAGLSPHVPIGIGDDAALLKTSGPVIVTTDMLMDGIDFIVGETPPHLIGRKSLAVNLSDIAAMAGRPTGAVISLALPKSHGGTLAGALYEGLFQLAAEFDCPIIGGDTNSWDGPLVINITVLGEPTGRSVVTRAGAEPGDWLFVTGALGGSLPSGRHCTFTPRIREAQALHASASLHSMLDISDGLASDLFHIAEASGVGLELDATAIPIHDDVDRSQPFANRLDHALNDGEDFELLFSVTESDARQLLTGPPPGVQLFTIGRCTESQRVWLRNGNDRTPLTRGGWQHQFS